MGRPVKKTLLQYVFIHPQTGGTRLITKQTGSRRYKCANNGDTVFTLVADATPAVGEAYMQAYDSDNNVYFVTKLTRHHATLVQKEQIGVPAFQFENNAVAKWDPWNPIVTGVSVYVENDI